MMRSKWNMLLVLVGMLALVAPAAHAEDLNFITGVGTVQKVDSESLTITLGDKSKKTLHLKVTGTSNFYLLTPQVRAGKTILTQRTGAASDLAKGQPVAVIYTEVEKEKILLDAVVKTTDQGAEKAPEKK